MSHRQTVTHSSWSDREVAIVSDPNLSPLEVAHQTGRTYQAVLDFRRHNGLTDGHREGEVRRSDRVSLIEPCACATLDGSHEGWCPAA